ncbi:transcription antitermination factor NusG [Mariniflexile fucanivorans]|uniref:Transcription antitermination factor NusG n=1 Tax=Mariniflexile fucanivorans TaxID=264023 RepID=A0A4R1RL02_9FLAO|nr:UpxY family transcription antiterminator [Mariniflexile fucanivorans]TCL66709.1 transcription antitermination factor NusG [Mariniflexile fucanivorans]
MNWFVLCVKAQQEKKVADILTKMQVEVYCPMLKETKVWSDRQKVVETPLFKSYVFVKLEEKYRGIVFGAPGVIRYLFYLGKPALVRDEEIWDIKKWMAGDSKDLNALSQLIPGSEIVIQNGVLKDHKGIVYWINKNNVSFFLKEMGVSAQVKLRDVV